ncbi:hypothetical protein CDL12_00836 [Handroanthus impetiginosus]|uniref:Uncharacterized protein n=1 Tax=Handroanthus impetiginosus TaxID=429701 RepID=A0A2G9I9I9_9LAMI|nr:hypothetical protein CDL12_00836 [Handroanthus impetiginosus]
MMCSSFHKLLILLIFNMNNLRAIPAGVLFFKTIEEELEEAKRRILERQKGKEEFFTNGISPVILTGEEIKGQGKNPLQVVLVDESTGTIADIGAASSATVDILLLKGVSNASEGDGDDWTVEQFNENILQNGIGILVNIKFRHHATKMRPSVFKLGARVVDTFHGVRIKEAKTESFVVKDFRKKYYIKHETPYLSDEVFRLKNIRKGGKIEKRLHDHNIRTVENFLIQHLIDPEGLKTIVNMGEKKWKLTVKNALACPRDKRMSYYTNEEKTVGVAFDLSGQIADAEELLAFAYKNWEKVEPFDNEKSVQHHFSALDHPVGGHENA